MATNCSVSLNYSEVRNNELFNGKEEKMSLRHGGQISSENTSSENLSSDTGSTTPRNEGTTSEASSSIHPSRIGPQEVVLTKSAGLGISISGGINRPGTGIITITDVIPGGDCYKDGRLRQGYELLSINGESLQGVTHETAKNILTMISLNRNVKTIVIKYKPSIRKHNNMRHNSEGRLSQLNGAATLPTPGNQRTVPNEDASKTLPTPRRSPGDGGHSLNRTVEGSTDHSHIRGGSPLVHDHISGEMNHLQNLVMSTVHMNEGGAVPPHMQRISFPEPNLHSTPHNAAFPAAPQAVSIPSPVLPANLQTPISGQANLSVSSVHSRDQFLDPTRRLKVEKLQVALEYLGLELTEEQNLNLRTHLQIDGDGMVQYGEFVAVVQQLFKMTLNENNLGVPPISTHDKVDTHFTQNVPDLVTVPVAKLESLHQERDQALLKASKYLNILQEKEVSFSRAEGELLQVRKNAQGAIHESRALKSRVHLAEVAQKEARNMEMDYEEVVRLLEEEIAELRDKLKDRPHVKKKEDGESAVNLRKRLAVLGGELRKSEMSKKTFEVATERLMQFAEFVHDHTVEDRNALNPGLNGEAAQQGPNGVYHPPSYLAIRHKKKGPVHLATEAKEVVMAVKALIEVEPLPYGWEETYTKDGSRFFTNHVTQTTSWVHPVSNISHLSSGVKILQDLPETVT